MATSDHNHVHKGAYRGGATWIDENEQKRKKIADMKAGLIGATLQKKQSMEYASSSTTTQQLDALPRYTTPQYFQKVMSF
jgi:hypothetical protein